MKFLSGEEEKEAMKFIDESAKTALKSTCTSSRCGSVIVKNGEIIGRGSDSPPADKESERRCSVSKDVYHKKVTDKTCCVHAEQRAIIDAIKNNSGKIVSSRLFFVRLDNKGSKTRSGKPYCTICSKMALDVGIAEFVLWHDEGICVYNTGEYNTFSFQYQE